MFLPFVTQCICKIIENLYFIDPTTYKNIWILLQISTASFPRILYDSLGKTNILFSFWWYDVHCPKNPMSFFLIVSVLHHSTIWMNNHTLHKDSLWFHKASSYVYHHHLHIWCNLLLARWKNNTLKLFIDTKCTLWWVVELLWVLFLWYHGPFPFVAEWLTYAHAKFQLNLRLAHSPMYLEKTISNEV